MSTPVLAWKHFGHSALHYLNWARILYDKVNVLHNRTPESETRLEDWRWHCVSADACVEEARRIYAEGLECLLQEPITVEYHCEDGPPVFVCYVGKPEGDGTRPSFRVRASVNGYTEEEQGALKALFGIPLDREVLEAFVRGLHRLDGLAAFRQCATMTLCPGLPCWKSTAEGAGASSRPAGPAMPSSGAHADSFSTGWTRRTGPSKSSRYSHIKDLAERTGGA